MDSPPFRVLHARLQALAAASVAMGRDDVVAAFPGAIAYNSPRGRVILLPQDDRKGIIFAAGPPGSGQAPPWVSSAVAERGLTGMGAILWFDGAWHSDAGADIAAQLAVMLPGFRTTAAAMVELLNVIDPARPSQYANDATYGLLYACETCTATRDLVRWMLRFTTVGEDAVDAAFAVLTHAGLTTETNLAPILDGVAGLSAADVIAYTALYLRANNIDASDYPPQHLRAERLEVGWLVTCPRPNAGPGRAVFFVGDDTEIQQSSTSVPPNEARDLFTRDYRARTQPPARPASRELNITDYLAPRQPATPDIQFANHFEEALWQTFHGHTTIADFIAAMSGASLMAVRSAHDPAVLDYLNTGDSPTLPIFTSLQFVPSQLPHERLYPLAGAFLLDAICPQPGVNIQFNPGRPLTAVLSGTSLTTWWTEWKQASGPSRLG